VESIVGGSGVVDNARGLEVGTKLIEKVGVVALKRCFRTRLMSIMSSSPRSKWLRLRGGFHVAQRTALLSTMPAEKRAFASWEPHGPSSPSRLRRASAGSVPQFLLAKV
jgi:hypothetical protein